MLNFLQRHIQFYLLIAIWIGAAVTASPLVYLLLPLTILLLRNKEQFPEMLFGFIMVLVLSDVHKDFHAIAVFKGAKNIYIVALTALFLNETGRFIELSKIFKIFLPFVAYSFFPLLFSPDPTVAAQKTLSYALLILVVPNYVLYSFRMQGWAFCRNLVFFLIFVLLFGLYFRYTGDGYVSGRFRGFFGNPNGLGLFCYLTLMLFAVVDSLNGRLFRYWERWLIYGIVLYFLWTSGSRASLISVFILFTFQRFFSGSALLGFVALLFFMVMFEYVYSNLGEIAAFLGAEDYLRVNTLESGSGRYFAWTFAWERVQDYFMFGGGFGTDEFVMRSNYDYLERMGHQGGVHNSYLSLWFDVGILGLLIYFRSFVLLFVKASRSASISMAVLFSVLFSVTYESWLVGSLNPFTILLFVALTLLSEEEIAFASPDFQGEHAGPEGSLEPRLTEA
ncbi:MAG: hypothetical protein KDB84_10460 [Flavobacteriales bacterium]|nr:hypothetical protein [Flavobacteriales bacterium]